MPKLRIRRGPHSLPTLVLATAAIIVTVLVLAPSRALLQP
ncbi:MAG: hypothetical protein JWO59_2206 [Chloroflexi bacterium]|nr:hypothetical protein [Chloroflexota bacterium]